MTKAVRGNRSSEPRGERVGVLVLGMHRSGTSALTRVLSLLGCDLPKTLVPAHPSNEAGHWESLPIVELNDDILNSAGTNQNDWLAFNPGWYASPKAAEFKERALSALAEEFGKSRLFALKDPRICRFAPFWLDVLDTAGVRPAIIMPIRNPLEVAESLFRRNGFDPALGHLLWLRHVLEAEAGSRGWPRFHTSFESLLTGWSSLAAAAQDKLGVSWPRLSALTGEEIDAFLTDRLRHHQASPRSISDNPLLSSWLRDAFAIFGRWAEEAEDEADYATLDRIRRELDAAAPAFARLISVGVQSAHRVQTLDASLQEAQDKLSAAEAAAAAQQQHVEALQRDMEELRLAVSASQAVAQQKETETQSLRNSLDEALAKLSHLTSELAQRRAELDDAANALQQAEARRSDELVQRQAELDAAASALQQAEARHSDELARRQAELDSAAHALQQAEARHSDELEAERARSAARVDEIASLTRLLRVKEDEALAAADRAAELASKMDEERHHANAELRRLRLEKGSAEVQLAERFNEIAQMTRMLGETESAAQVSDEHIAWLRQVSIVLLNGSNSASLKSRLTALLPAPIRSKKQIARLKRQGIFDSEAYLAANPDVAEAGLDPLWHYINHGIGEGRRLHSNQSTREN